MAQRLVPPGAQGPWAGGGGVGGSATSTEGLHLASACCMPESVPVLGRDCELGGLHLRNFIQTAPALDYKNKTCVPHCTVSIALILLVHLLTARKEGFFFFFNFLFCIGV